MEDVCVRALKRLLAASIAYGDLPLENVADTDAAPTPDAVVDELIEAIKLAEQVLGL